jgi:hypothetical protein
MFHSESHNKLPINNDAFDIFNNQHLYNKLVEIEQDNNLLVEISKRSYLHVNNFYKINIGKLDDGTTIRIHLWKVADINENQNPHSHGWNFESKILYGEIKNMDFEETDDENGIFFKFVQNLTQHKGISIVNNTSIKCLLTNTKSNNYKTGDSYKQIADKIHTSIPIIDRSITIIKQGPIIRDFCDIYTKTKIVPEDRRPNVTIDELLQIINEVKNRLK